MEGEKRRVHLLMLTLVLATFLAAADETIVVASTETILKELNQADGGWISMGYLLGLTATMPLCGKVSDIFGKRATMLGGVFLFMAGSMGCGAAPNIMILVVSRGFCGAGAAVMIALPYMLIADAVYLAGRAPHLSAIECAFTLSSALGPLIGGFLTDFATWRLAFLLNFPLCIFVALGLMYAVPSRKHSIRLTNLNIQGAVFLVLAIAFLVVGATSESYTSKISISCFMSGLVLLMAHIYIELYRSVDPIVPKRILTRNVVCASLGIALVASPFFVCMYFIPQCQQCSHISALSSGLGLLPFLISVCVASMLSGIFVHRLQIYRPLIWIGLTLITVSCSLMARISCHTLDLISSASIGCGIGLNLQPMLMACHASVDPKDVSSVSTLYSFCLSIGGVLGLALQTSMFNNNITTMGYESAYRRMFLYMIPTSALGFAFSLLIKHIPLSHPLEHPL